MDIKTHPDTFLDASAVGAVMRDFQRTYSVPGAIHQHETYLTRLPDNALITLTAPGLLDHNQGEIMGGWLWKADALKLYELAYFATGDVLEVGTYAGLSTCIMAQAILDSGRTSRLVPIDIEDHGWKKNAELNQVSQIIDFRLGPATEEVAKLIANQTKFSFAFVDHSHTYEEVALICPMLDKVLLPGSFVLFHDYNDPRNGHLPEYGVWQAVIDKLPPTFAFCGVYGCSGLYRLQS